MQVFQRRPCRAEARTVRFQARIDAALTGAVDVLWLTDKKGRDVAVASAKIAFVEVGSGEADRRIGFGG